MQKTAIHPIKITLYGAAQCRRYKTMRQRVLKVAQNAGISLDFQEENDTGALSKHNPLHLPILQVESEFVARADPPSLAELHCILRRHIEQTEAD